MQVAKWGNSLAVRLPSTVVEALDLKEGDQIEIRIAGERSRVCWRTDMRWHTKKGGFTDHKRTARVQ